MNGDGLNEYIAKEMQRRAKAERERVARMMEADAGICPDCDGDDMECVTCHGSGGEESMEAGDRRSARSRVEGGSE